MYVIAARMSQSILIVQVLARAVVQPVRTLVQPVRALHRVNAVLANRDPDNFMAASAQRAIMLKESRSGACNGTTNRDTYEFL